MQLNCYYVAENGKIIATNKGGDTVNAYEQMKNKFLVELDSADEKLSAATLTRICRALDRASYGYEVSEKTTALTTTSDDIPSLVKMYLVIKKTEGLSEKTLNNYLIVLKLFFLWSRKQPEEITANDIRMFLYHHQTSNKVSDRTLDKYRQIICWFFKWAHFEEYIDKNPARSVRAIRHEIKERQALSQIELEYLRMACKTKRDKAMLEFFYSTGCRVSELCTVKKSDIDWHNNTVHIFGKGRKHRTSFINAKCEVTLKEYLAQRNDEDEHLFVTERKPYHELQYPSAEKVIRDLGARAGIGKRISPHILRHTTATQAMNNGMAIEEVSKLLGHADIATTMIYTKVSDNSVQAKHAKCVI